MLYEHEYNEKIKSLFEKEIHSFSDYSYQTNMTNHIYKISQEERKDFRNEEVYSIDPDGCEDADDAFSIFESNEELYLAVHIADPTEYLILNDEIWHAMMKQNTTKYPSNMKPFHLLPHSILEKANLKTNSVNPVTKNAISVCTKINKNTY